ncbi:indoleamine 2,3-dioxygenase 1, partial [Reticulomyxa filosa]
FFLKKKKKKIGGSAAQSALFQCLDVFLNVVHPNSEFLDEMLSYMALEHRSFIAKLKTLPKFLNLMSAVHNKSHGKLEPREAALAQEIVQMYSQEAIAVLRKFRTIHLGIAAYYVVAPAEKAQQEIKGTGGSSVVPYLKSIRDDTVVNADASKLFPKQDDSRRSKL